LEKMFQVISAILSSPVHVRLLVCTVYFRAHYEDFRPK
jgi:hypothetical protein